MSASSFRFYAFLILLLTARLVFLALTKLPLDCEEAQYWSWGAESLSWGYFSKPPITSWLMALMTDIGGRSAFWVRCLSPVFHFIIALMIYRWARMGMTVSKARLASLLYFTLPGTFFSSILMTTDVPMLLMSSVCLYFVWQGIQKQRLASWVLAGLFLGLAMLSKYIAAFIPLSVIGYALFNDRQIFKQLGLYVMLGVAGVIMLPHLYWLSTNDFTTITHTLHSNMVVNTYGTKLNFNAFFEYIGGQFAVFGPLLIGMILTKRFWRPVQALEKFSHWLIWPLFTLMCLQGLLAKVNLNWGILIVFGVVLLTAMVKSERFLRQMIVTNTVIGVIGVGFLFDPYASMQASGVKYKGLKHYQLLEKAMQHTHEICPEKKMCHLIADHRCVAALARFYGEYASAHKWYRGEGGKDYFEWTSPYKVRNNNRAPGSFFILTQRPLIEFARIDKLWDEVKIVPDHTLYYVSGTPGSTLKYDS